MRVLTLFLFTVTTGILQPTHSSCAEFQQKESSEIATTDKIEEHNDVSQKEQIENTQSTCQTENDNVAEENHSDQTQVPDIITLSKAIGHLIGSSTESISDELAQESVLEGLSEYFRGNPSPISDSECAHAIAIIQDKKYRKHADENLKLAEHFLATNITTKGMYEVVPGQLQYKVEKEGRGASVTSTSNPKIEFTGRFLNGEIFQALTTPEVVALEDLIPGMSKGIIGMKEGEERTIYIHPDMGFGMAPNFSPNALLTISCKVVQANCDDMNEIETDLSSELLAQGTAYSETVNIR